MVRLKDSIKFERIKITEISIPYGAIKRNGYIKGFDITREFQFLMVRLKVY